MLVENNLLIAIDGHRLVDEPMTSGATYLRGLLREWQKLEEPPQILLCLPRKPIGIADPVLDAANVELAIPDTPCAPTASFRAQCAWQQWVIPQLLRRHRPAVYFSPFHQAPQLPIGLKVVTAIHDLCFLGEPPLSLGSIIHRIQVFTACARSHRLICVSRFTAAVLRQWWPWAGRKASVVHNGFLSQPISEWEARQQIEHLGGEIRPQGYFLWIGSPSFRKNPEGLLDSFALYCKRNSPEQRLVIVAPVRSHALLQMLAQARGIADELTLLAPVSNDLRDALYRQATALVFPSRCEGFAYPLLEAMVQGCPVIACRNSPAREIVADAFPLVDDLAPAKIVDIMEHAAGLAEAEREALGRRLEERTKHFSTQAMAAGTLAVILEVATSES